VTAGGLDESVWRATYEEGRKAFPGVAIGLAQFAAHATRVGAPDPKTTPHGCELFLACACGARDPRGIVALERDYLPLTRGSLARFSASSDFVDEVLQELRAKLLLGAEPRIVRYGARGPLLSWIRVAASRVAIDLLRSTPAEERDQPDGETSADPITDVDLGPEVQLLRSVYREAFRDALASTLGALSAQDRNLLRRHLLDRLTLQEIAAPYGVHPATIARRLVSLREDIARTVRETLAVQHQEEGGSTSLESLARAIRSEIDLSLSPLLSGGEGPSSLVAVPRVDPSPSRGARGGR
jgi:RNA polymerase sigma-70 factor (ECF subfamily)